MQNLKYQKRRINLLACQAPRPGLGFVSPDSRESSGDDFHRPVRHGPRNYLQTEYRLLANISLWNKKLKDIKCKIMTVTNSIFFLRTFIWRLMGLR
jgi:hypothetical protein